MSQPDYSAHIIKVFGSAVIRVEPDIASLRFAVSREAEQPKDAFEATHEAVKRVRAYLSQTGTTSEVAASRITLSREFDFMIKRVRQAKNYTAKVAFNVLLADLERTEELLVGIVDAGANSIEEVDYRTSELKKYRAEARRQAVATGREKAHVYCQAAGVTLGAVVSIEDSNPMALRGSGEGHSERESSLDDGPPERAFAPGSIVVAAAVNLVFALTAPA